ncbi:MAG: signal peptidase I [Candidatus Omnitrophica bacterium]|nr:signal peptidase I [Candidatus Omnitrophota bacterium]
MLNKKGQIYCATIARVPPKVRKWIREWAETLVVAVGLALLIRSFLVQPFKIPSGSMHPTLKIGDRLIVNKLRYGGRVPLTEYRLPGFGKPERGDIIVFDYPVDPSRDFIKRLIAFGGETVRIKDGHIYVNDRQLDEPRIAGQHYFNMGSLSDEKKSVTVPEGQVYVLGDNSASSADSRYWGFVPEKNIIGRAEWIYWPPGRISQLK